MRAPDAHMLDLLPKPATKFFQHISDSDSWYSISDELLAAGGLEDLEARLAPRVEQVSGASAAVLMIHRVCEVGTAPLMRCMGHFR